ncbi:MAG TPA: GumC family protein [Pirellulales bacterium]
MIAPMQENSLGSFVSIPWRHKGKVLATFAGVVLAAIVVTMLLPRSYRSEGKLLLRLGRENMALDPTATLASSSVLTIQQSRENEINSVIEILRSRVVIEKVVDAIGADVILGHTAWHEDAVSADSSVGAGSTVTSTAGAVAKAKEPAAGSPTEQAATDAAAADAELAKADKLKSDRLHTEQTREAAIRRFSRSLSAEAVRKSNVLEVTYEAPSPEMAQAVVTKLISVFLDDYVRLNRTPGAQEFLSEQTNSIRAQLQQKEDQLRNLKNETGLSDPDVTRNLAVTRIGHLKDEALTVTSDLASVEAEVKKLHEQLNSLPANEITEQTAGFANEAADGMRQQLYTLQLREQELAAKYTDDHPLLKQVRDQIVEAQNVLHEEKPERTQIKTAVSKPHEEVKLQLLKQEPVLAALKAKAENLKSQIASETKALDKLNENEMQVAQLQREVQLQEANYRKYTDSLEQARIDRVMADEGKSNISIAQPATFDLQPVKPNTALNLLAGLVLATVCGIGVAFAAESLDGAGGAAARTQRQADLSATRVVTPHLNPRPVSTADEYNSLRGELSESRT